MGIFSQEQFLAAIGSGERASLMRVGGLRTYLAGELVLRQGDRETFVVAILSGWCSVGATAGNGRSVLFGLCGPMDLVGEMAAFDGGSRSASVSALTEVKARVFAGDAFRAFLDENPTAYRTLVRGMSLRLRAADSQNEALATLPVTSRLARLLIDLEDRYRVADAPRLAQHELAAAIGATRESVAKALAELRARGVLRTEGRRATVLDLQALTIIADL